MLDQRVLEMGEAAMRPQRQRQSHNSQPGTQHTHRPRPRHKQAVPAPPSLSAPLPAAGRRRLEFPSLGCLPSTSSLPTPEKTFSTTLHGSHPHTKPVHPPSPRTGTPLPAARGGCQCPLPLSLSSASSPRPTHLHPVPPTHARLCKAQ